MVAQDLGTILGFNSIKLSLCDHVKRKQESSLWSHILSLLHLNLDYESGGDVVHNLR